MALINPQDILYEDDALIVINKPAGLLSIEDGYQPNLPNLKSILHAMRGSIRSVHRLDKCTSGAVLFAKTDEAHRAINTAFENRDVKKRYVAIVHGFPCWQTLELSMPLLKNGDREHRTVFHTEKGKVSHSSIAVARRNERFSLMEISPKTGFTHQIRSQLSTIGFPILGDDLYNRTVNINTKRHYQRENLQHIYLHARQLSLRHPGSGMILEIDAPAPSEFEQKIRELGLG